MMEEDVSEVGVRGWKDGAGGGEGRGGEMG